MYVEQWNSRDHLATSKYESMTPGAEGDGALDALTSWQIRPCSVHSAPSMQLQALHIYLLERLSAERRLGSCLSRRKGHCVTRQLALRSELLQKL